MSGTIDTLIVFRILRLLTKSWEDQEAYKLGIIDSKGKPLKKASSLKTSEERSAYTLLHRLVFNLKRLLAKAPGGRTKLASYIAALALIKEHVHRKGGNTEYLLERLKDHIDIPQEVLSESHDIGTIEGYLDSIEEMLLKEFGIGSGGISGVTTANPDSSGVDDGHVVKKKRKNRFFM